MGEVINLKNFKDTGTISASDRLVLLCSYYFQEEFGDHVFDLGEEVKFTLAIMTYKFLLKAQKAGELVINDKGFLVTGDVRSELRQCVMAAIQKKNEENG